MGFTKGTEGGGFTYIKIKGLKKEDAEHYFEVGGERVEDNKFVGTLTNMETSSYEYEGKEKQTVKMMFVDGGEKFQLDISYNSISRNLINSLLGFVRDNPEVEKMELELSLYMNKGGFKSLGLLINGERANWFYSMDEQKALTERITNKAGELISNDYSELDGKLKEGVGKIKALVTSGANPFDSEDIPF